MVGIVGEGNSEKFRKEQGNAICQRWYCWGNEYRESFQVTSVTGGSSKVSIEAEVQQSVLWGSTASGEKRFGG